MLARGENGWSLAGAWQRIRPPTKAIPPPNGRSAGGEFGRAIDPPFWSLEARVLGFEQCGGEGAREKMAEPLAGAWRRVPPPMAIFPPYNDISGDDLSLMVVFV